MFKVYVLYSIGLRKYYVGSTEDVVRRLNEHNAGKAKFTSKGIPWSLIAQFECESRSKAIKLEYKIKKRGIRRYLEGT